MSGEIMTHKRVFDALLQAGLVNEFVYSVTFAANQHNPELEPWDNETTNSLEYVTIIKDSDAKVWLSWMDDPDV